MIAIGDKVVLAKNKKREMTVIQLLGGQPDPWVICIEDGDRKKKHKAFNYRLSQVIKSGGK